MIFRSKITQRIDYNSRSEVIKLDCQGDRIQSCQWQDIPEQLEVERSHHVSLSLPESYDICNWTTTKKWLQNNFNNFCRQTIHGEFDNWQANQSKLFRHFQIYDPDSGNFINCPVIIQSKIDTWHQSLTLGNLAGSTIAVKNDYHYEFAFCKAKIDLTQFLQFPAIFESKQNSSKSKSSQENVLTLKILVKMLCLLPEIKTNIAIWRKNIKIDKSLQNLVKMLGSLPKIKTNIAIWRKNLEFCLKNCGWVHFSSKIMTHACAKW